jgi:Uma2 family endonuclease
MPHPTLVPSATSVHGTLAFTMSEPAWDIATLFPLQGAWSEEEYLDLADQHRRVEFNNGVIEVLPVPTRIHQNVLKFLLWLLDAYVARVGGITSFAGTRLKLPENKYREPDLLFATKEHAHFETEELWTGADLVMEIVSGSVSDHERDYVTKREDYARGEVAEYWIVDPERKTILVLVLRGNLYVEHGTFSPGARVTSPTFAGFTVDVTAVFEAQR